MNLHLHRQMRNLSDPPAGERPSRRPFSESCYPYDERLKKKADETV